MTPPTTTEAEPEIVLRIRDAVERAKRRGEHLDERALSVFLVRDAISIIAHLDRLSAPPAGSELVVWRCSRCGAAPATEAERQSILNRRMTDAMNEERLQAEYEGRMYYLEKSERLEAQLVGLADELREARDQLAETRLAVAALQPEKP